MGVGLEEGPIDAVSQQVTSEAGRARRSHLYARLDGEKAVEAELRTVSVQMGDGGVSVLGGDVRVPQQTVQNKHSQARDVTVVFQRDELPEHCLGGNQSHSQDWRL